MTKEEYQKEKAVIEDERTQKIRELNKRYALENNPYKVGDIIQDHIGKGRIIRWSVYYRYDYPSLVYRCINLTKAGTVNKREPERDIYQGNLK